jgi:hypothetical protein
MPSPSAKSAVPHISVTTAADDKWKQQVRLACIQAVAARAVASNAVYDVEASIAAAETLAEFVITGNKPRKSIAG